MGQLGQEILIELGFDRTAVERDLAGGGVSTYISCVHYTQAARKYGRHQPSSARP